MALKIKNTEVERLAAEGAPITGETRPREQHQGVPGARGVPNIPNNILGKKITTREREEILGIQI
jgi:hypothetical protein